MYIIICRQKKPDVTKNEREQIIEISMERGETDQTLELMGEQDCTWQGLDKALKFLSFIAKYLYFDSQFPYLRNHKIMFSLSLGCCYGTFWGMGQAGLSSSYRFITR